MQSQDIYALTCRRAQAALNRSASPKPDQKIENIFYITKNDMHSHCKRGLFFSKLVLGDMTKNLTPQYKTFYSFFIFITKTLNSLHCMNQI